MGDSPRIRACWDHIHAFPEEGNFSLQSDLEDALEKQPPCLVLKHMDRTSQSMKPEEWIKNLAFQASFFRSNLEVLSFMEKNDMLWTGDFWTSRPNRRFTPRLN